MADPKGYSGLSRVLGALGGFMLGGAAGFVGLLVLGMLPGALGAVLGLAAFFGTPLYGAYKGYQVVKKSQELPMQAMAAPAPVAVPEPLQGMQGPTPMQSQAVQQSANAPEARPEFLDTILTKGKGAATPERIEQTQGTGAERMA